MPLACNNTKVKIATIIGARPQFIKAAPVSRAISKQNLESNGAQIEDIVIHTGQHYDHNMSQVFFEQLMIHPPKYNLEVGSGAHGEMTGIMLGRIEEVLLKEKPEFVLVYGDTNSTLAGALAAAKLFIPVAHVEAGLRSFNRRMPEEVNRVLTDHLSDLLFCPTETSVRNLTNEGIIEGVFQTGDVMYDAFRFHKEQALKSSPILSQLNLRPKEYSLATVHRQESTDEHEALSNIFNALEKIAAKDCPLIIPLHPRTKKVLEQSHSKQRKNPWMYLISPVGYLDMIALESQAKVILTDSGGIQKEAYFAQIPCVTLRDETEWLETLEDGWNHLGGRDSSTILQAYQAALRSNRGDQSKPYGDGSASRLILQHMLVASDRINNRLQPSLEEVKR
jgi:UDP-GlcNAc3NAcA epimerase